jgi:hypothetical protein
VHAPGLKTGMFAQRDTDSLGKDETGLLYRLSTELNSVSQRKKMQKKSPAISRANNQGPRKTQLLAHDDAFHRCHVTT